MEPSANSSPGWSPTLGGVRRWTALTLGVGLAAGWAGLVVPRVHVQDKELSGLEWSPSPRPAPAALEPLPIRLVDAGGVGIPADTAKWGTSYSHATDAFDAMILDEAPYVDAALFDEIRSQWTAYLDRMAEYGNNAVVLDAFLELVLFDRVEQGTAVYGSAARNRHAAVRDAFALLIDDARARGFDAYLKTDLPAVTDELASYLRGRGLTDTADPAFWEVYGAGLEELFAAVPTLAGVVVRVGEAGPLFHSDGSPYRSYMGVREPEELRQLLRTLLPVFEDAGRTLILRNWSVGVGPLGNLHHDPELYARVLGDIDSPALIVSTKFVAGDYFGFLPLNPTLAVGPHRRLVEMQARREFEGFGALPNYLGETHRRAFEQLRAANPNLVGMQLWTQEGGPLRAGPLSLYTVAGFWRWTDANVYATSRLAVDPSADPRALLEEWARATVADDPVVAAGLADLLGRSREALEKAIYIRPYARRRADVVGVQAPPILWIFEWDVLGGWSSVLSTVYHALDGDVEPAIAEGFEALDLARAMRADLAALEPRLGTHPEWEGMARSLEYQESLYETLAWYRSTFLRYYAWLDGGGAPVWREDADRFLHAAERHADVWGSDLDFPAFDFAPAVVAVERARAQDRDRTAARLLLGALLATLALGAVSVVRRRALPGTGWARALLVASSSPWRLPDERGTTPLLGWGIGAVVVAGAAAAASLALSVEIRAAGAVLGALLLSWVVALGGSWSRGPAIGARLHHAAAGVAPLLLAVGAGLAVMAVRGPAYLWYLFWTDDAFRAASFAVGAAAGTWTLASSHALGRRAGGRPELATGSLLIASGFALLVTGVLLPDLPTLLAALDEPLHLLPMRPAIIHGITEYAAVPGATVRLPTAGGAVLLCVGAALRWKGTRRAARP